MIPKIQANINSTQKSQQNKPSFKSAYFMSELQNEKIMLHPFDQVAEFKWLGKFIKSIKNDPPEFLYKKGIDTYYTDKSGQIIAHRNLDGIDGFYISNEDGKNTIMAVDDCSEREDDIYTDIIKPYYDKLRELLKRD